MSEVESKGWERLTAYHDGELGALARWRFERRLRRSKRLRSQLEALVRIGELVRASEARASAPDLWDRIEQRLPALEARRAEAAERFPPSWLLRPVGAMAVAAAVLFAVYSGVRETPAAPAGVVRWVDSGGRSVMVLEDDAEAQVTIIWLLDDPMEGAAWGGMREAA